MSRRERAGGRVIEKAKKRRTAMLAAARDSAVWENIKKHARAECRARNTRRVGVPSKYPKAYGLHTQHSA